MLNNYLNVFLTTYNLIFINLIGITIKTKTFILDCEMNLKNSDKLNFIPQLPGVYLMKDDSDKIIYIGKAKNLKKRVLSYFRKNLDSAKTEVLVNNIVDLDYLTTDNEREALLLEANLIKKHKPKYNINLKDSKTYPFIAFSVEEDFPRIFKTRNSDNKKDIYIGPYPNIEHISRLIKMAHNLFPIRYCRKKISENKKNGSRCLYYHIGKCNAPCQANISSKEYRQEIDKAILLLKGEQKELLTGLLQQMQKYSQEMEFEKATKIRDQIEAIQTISEPQGILVIDSNEISANMDILNYHTDATIAVFVVLQIRSGKLQGYKLFIDKEVKDKPDIFKQFFALYLSKEDDIPPTIITPKKTFIKREFQELLIDIKIIKEDENNCTLTMKKLLSQGKRNALLALEEELSMNLFKTGLAELKDILQLPKIPLIIEGFDIANLGDEAIVAGMAHFSNGKPLKSEHRHYIIKSTSKQDDFRSMQEVVIRRYQRLQNESKPFPDLILIDGGKGQLKAALTGLKALGLTKIPIISLAKKEELIYRPGKNDPIRLNHNSYSLRILQQVRDEVHRVVNKFHKQRRDKVRKKSELEDIPGVGRKSRIILLKHYGSIKKIRLAPLDELEKVINNKKTAQHVFAYFNKNN